MTKVLIGDELREEVKFCLEGYEDHGNHLYQLLASTNANIPLDVTSELYHEIIELEDRYGEPMSKINPKIWKQMKQFYLDVGVARPMKETRNLLGKKLHVWFTQDKVKYEFESHPKFTETEESIQC
jgi:hypothetical protein